MTICYCTYGSCEDYTENSIYLLIRGIPICVCSADSNLQEELNRRIERPVFTTSICPVDLISIRNKNQMEFLFTEDPDWRNERENKYGMF